MCGIVGVWRPADDDEARLHAAMSRLKHRGPDGEGLMRDPGCLLGHRRLSIVDVKGGGQPLYNENYDVAVIYNGEIYNHKDLKSSLKEKHRFATQSDGEVIAHVYEERGAAEMVASLHGMFAIALWDRQRLVLARDPLGIKPLYWSRAGNSIYFASEIKSLLPLCPAESIETFPPGHFFMSDAGLAPFWQLEESVESHRPDNPRAEEDLACMQKELMAGLEASVQLRLMADVPVGVFLSGGLDSSIIAALMARHVKELHTFAVGLRGSPDLEKARVVAARLRTQHHEVLLQPEDVARALKSIIYHLESYDPDLVKSAVPTYFVSREAARYVKVVLTGEGADELFAGYDYHLEYMNQHRMLNDELVRSIRNLHHINLQRADRMSMAHGLEARVPFLDVSFVSQAMRIPPQYKLSPQGNKLVLRHAAENLVGSDIAWRPKEQFDQGSGSGELLKELLTDNEVEAETGFKSLFYESFPKSVERLVARWRNDRITAESPER